MANLSYSFCISLLHSLWQAALLWLVYSAVSKSLGTKFAPAQKRNLLFTSLFVQLFLFVITFSIYLSSYQTDYSNLFYISGIADVITPASSQNITPWLFTVYTLAVTYKLVKAVYNWWWFKKQFNSNLIKPSVDLKLFTTSHQHQFGIKRNVQLWLSKTINTPLTFGFLKPVIVLPFALVNQLSIQQTETLILHELAHIKANDFLLNWFVIITETIFFFNPFVLLICKQVKQEREKNCDIAVTAFNYQPLIYAEALLKAQTVKQLSPALLSENFRIAAVNKPQHLLHRIQFFINPANQLQPVRKKIIFPAAALLLTTAITIIALLQMRSVKKSHVVPALQAQIAPLKNNNTNEFAVTVNNVINSLTEEKLEKIAAAVEKHQPEIEKAVKKLEPLLIEIEKQATNLAKETETNLATPVSLQEAVIEKKIVIKEETSGSKNATIKVYTVVYKDGKWQLKPQWKLAAKEITSTDSLDLIDTSAPAIEEDADMQD